MRNRLVGWMLAGAAALVFSPSLAAQTALPPGTGKAKPAPRRSDGTPDLSGLWAKEPGFGFLAVGEEPAMLPWAKARYTAGRQGVRRPQDRPRGDLERATDDLDPNAYPYCLPKGFPRIYDGPHPFEIVHSPCPGLGNLDTEVGN